MRNSINLKIYQKIKKKYKKTFSFDPFVVDAKLKSNINIDNIGSFDVVIFLTKGKIYEKLYNKIANKKPDIILDPFYYYLK